LWDLERVDGVYRRVLNREYANEFARSRELLASIGCV
jgi:hypothetical protein